MMPLTKRQREVYDFVADYVRQHRYAPKFDEIAEAMQLRSISSVAEYLSTLEEKGFITRESRRPRGIRLIPLADDPLAARDAEIVQLRRAIEWLFDHRYCVERLHTHPGPTFLLSVGGRRETFANVVEAVLSGSAAGVH
jgi:SOS-response transcriptional repressor LexA